MAVATKRPMPQLGLAAVEARKAARAQHPARTRTVRAFQKVMASIAITFAVLGFGGGTAQAWPWEVAQHVTAYFTNFCGPNDIRSLSTFQGPDTSFGLNADPGGVSRATIIPKVDQAQGEGNGLDRIERAYKAADGSATDVVHPSYARYGFSSLQWTNYGGDCFSVGYWFTGTANQMLNVAVHAPMIAGMSALALAMPGKGTDIVGQIVGANLDGLSKIVGDIFLPFAFIIGPVGLIVVFARSRGSLIAVTKAAVWVVAMIGTMMWISGNTSPLVRAANNIVTTVTADAAGRISQVTTGRPMTADNVAGSTNQALWYGVSYQTWLLGEVGPDAARVDAEREKAGQMGWGPAILNGRYLGVDESGRVDDAGTQLVKRVTEWNSASYAPETDNFLNNAQTKVSSWTDEDIYNDVPLLFAVGAMCNDKMDGSWGGSTDPSANRWMYGKSCDAAGAGAATIIPYFQGQMYDHQMVVVFSGAIGALASILAVSAAALYLAAQKLMFSFFLMTAPIFLAISTFADEKRRGFAKRYFELLAMNVLKQIVGVLAVLFISNSMSVLLYRNDLNIPTLMRPYASVLFLIALGMFLIPLTGIMKGAVRGDTSVVDKTYKAPAEAAKASAKVAAVAGVGLAAVAAAPALGGLGQAVTSGQASRALSTAGRAVGARSGLGKTLMSGARSMRGVEKATSMFNDRKNAAETRQSGIAQMLAGGSGTQYLADLASKGMYDPTTKTFTKAGQKQVKSDYNQMVNAGLKSGQAEMAQKKAMSQFFAGHRIEEGKKEAVAAGLKVGPGGAVDPKAAAAVGIMTDAMDRPIVHHSLDPEGPEMKAAAEEQARVEREEKIRKRNAASAEGEAGKAPTAAKIRPVPEGIPVDSRSGLPADPALARAAKAGLLISPEGTVDPAAAAAVGVSVDADNKPLMPAAAAAAAGVALSANVAEGVVTDEQRAAERMSQAGFAAAAQGQFEGPAFARNVNVQSTVTASGETVLSQLGMTREDAATNPAALLTGAAYDSGTLTTMDPKHPATAALADLKFAAAHGTGEEEEAATVRASEAIATHGVPDHVSSTASVGAPEKFRAGEIIGAMPTLSKESTWAERSTAAKTMLAASATLPEGHVATDAVRDYTSALANPTMDVAEVAHLKAIAITALDSASVPDESAAMFGGSVEVPNMAMAGSVSAASGATVAVANGAAAAPAVVRDGQGDRYPTDVPSFGQSISGRAAELGAVPVADGDLTLGYVTTVAGQTYTAASRTPLDALNGHADGLLASVIRSEDQENVLGDVSFAERGLQERLVRIGEQHYGVTPVAGEVASDQPVTTVAGQMFTAPDRATLGMFDRDANEFAASPFRAEEGVVLTDSQVALHQAGVQYASDSDAIVEMVRKVERGAGDAEFRVDEVPSGGGVPFPAPSAAPMFAADSGAGRDMLDRMFAVAQEHYDVAPVAQVGESLGYTTVLAGESFTAASPEPLKRFVQDVKTYVAPVVTPSVEGDEPTIVTEVGESGTDGQRALSAASAAYVMNSMIPRDVSKDRGEPSDEGTPYQAMRVIQGADGPSFAAQQETAPGRRYVDRAETMEIARQVLAEERAMKSDSASVAAHPVADDIPPRTVSAPSAGALSKEGLAAAAGAGAAAAAGVLKAARGAEKRAENAADRAASDAVESYENARRARDAEEAAQTFVPREAKRTGMFGGDDDESDEG